MYRLKIEHKKRTELSFESIWGLKSAIHSMSQSCNPSHLSEKIIVII